SHKTKRLLVVVTENAAIDMLRKNKHYAPVSYDELENVLSMDKDMLDSVAVQELVDLICELPEIYRDVLELRAYHGLSEKQIAAILDVEYATVRKRLERARTMLAEKMKQQEGEVYEHL
ncbi:MAG: sigma-70 family RNA polymerase sigma factor, partial [Clostridia bacterium]|nr:sigma-70 family RNA polymerase sigma factor [Clostridia bacterium]